MSTIDRTTVQHVALLSRLSLSKAEIELYSKQLASILKYINKLNQVNVDHVAPTSHALSTLKNVFREDRVRPSLSVDEALANAPARDGDFFKVPPVIEGK